jgi:uncharacterized protein (DUF2249 family)/iron-sulfur cluster repair protein YtfE (RIC family)
MNTVVLATSEQEAAAVEAVVTHHAAMAGALAAHSERLLDAHATEQAADARDELVHWAVTELLPHARAEEQRLYPLAHEDPAGRLLVDALLAEHELITTVVEQLRVAETPVRAAASGTALRVLFESHVAKENDQVLPLLAAKPGVSVAQALHGMHESLGAEDHAVEDHAVEDHAVEDHAVEDHGADDHAADDHGAERVAGAFAAARQAPAGSAVAGSSCGCGEHDGRELPELDARAVPHAIRHATIFGALEAVRPGGGLVLVAPHDPLPLLKQLEQRNPGTFAVDYLERGPEAWRLRFQRG